VSELTQFLHKTDAVILSAAIAALGVVVSVVVSALISRRTNYLNVVTAERSKWIEKLRNNLANYSALAQAVSYQSRAGDFEEITSPEFLKLLREIRDTRSQLKLQLNPRGEIDQNIILVVDRIYDLCRDSTVGRRLDAAERLLILHSQWLLKAEWDKVKAEASWSIFGWRKLRETMRLREYRKFATMTPSEVIDATPAG
jgi:hypothetical protein